MISESDYTIYHVCFYNRESLPGGDDDDDDTDDISTCDMQATDDELKYSENIYHDSIT